MMQQRHSTFWSEGFGSFGVAIGIALLIRWALVEAYVIPSGSMLPTLLVNDHIFVNKIAFGLRVPFTSDWLLEFSSPRRGDVVVFRSPAEPNLYYIKRVVGLPGDTVLYERGNLYVNQQLVERTVPRETLKEDWHWLRDEDFIGDLNAGGKNRYTHWQETLEGREYSVLLRNDEALDLEFGPFQVPDRHFFVMGDNRDNSQDSRLWSSGSVRASGHVTFRLAKASQQKITIPAGTWVATATENGRSYRYQTLAAVDVGEQPVSVEIEALSSGPQFNVQTGEITELIDENLRSQVLVSNSAPVLGGDDQRYVPREYLVGRAMFVWLSCEETLPVLTFLCHPLSIRWGRFFDSIH